MQEWEWIEEPRYAEDFEHLFDGENRNCNIRWIGKPLVILTELTKRLLKQSYMDEQKGVSASSIVQKQFGKNRSSNTDRLDENAEKQINTILYILDYKKSYHFRPKKMMKILTLERQSFKMCIKRDAYKKELHVKNSSSNIKMNKVSICVTISILFLFFYPGILCASYGVPGLFLCYHFLLPFIVFW